MKLVCVLRSGGDFDTGDLWQLHNSAKKFSLVATEFVCLTDVYPGTTAHVDFKVLRHDWPGYWAKLEAFRIPGPCLYIDLDSVIVGDLSPIMALIEDSPRIIYTNGGKRGFASGVMGWNEDLSWIPEQFDRLRKRFVPRTSPTGRRYGLNCSDFDLVDLEPDVPQASGCWYLGDQDYLRRVFGRRKIVKLPDVYSYKNDIKGGKLPDDAAIICFHGKPRPRDVSHPWMDQ